MPSPKIQGVPQPDLRRQGRVESHLIVRIADRRTVDRQTRAYLEEIAENVGLGGLFIRTPSPQARGTKLALELQLTTDGESAPSVKANAIVRWSRRWVSGSGMGVEFLDFESNGRDDLERFVDLVAESPEVTSPGAAAAD